MSEAARTNSTPDTHLTISDLNTTINHEPRILDLLLAERLRLTQPLNVRRVIENNRGELELHGEVFTRDVKTAGIQGGRPSKEFWLNEGQALVICSLSRTPVAAAIRYQVITVYMEYRRQQALGQTVPVSAHARRPPLARADDITRLAALIDRLEKLPALHPSSVAPSPVEKHGMAAVVIRNELVIIDTLSGPTEGEWVVTSPSNQDPHIMTDVRFGINNGPFVGRYPGRTVTIPTGMGTIWGKVVERRPLRVPERKPAMDVEMLAFQAFKAGMALTHAGV